MPERRGMKRLDFENMERNLKNTKQIADASELGENAIDTRDNPITSNLNKKNTTGPIEEG